MNTSRKIAVLVGVLFLTAMAASLVGGGLVESAISAPDYLAAVAENETQLIVGLLLELVNAIAVLGIGVLMVPILGSYNETMARGYLGFRLVEAVFCGAIVIGPLALLILSQNPLQAAALGVDAIHAVGALAMALRASIVGLLIPIFFSLGGLVLYTSLYQARLVPRFIAVWGLVAVTLVLAMNLLSLTVELDMNVALIFALPIILNEILLGIWLIVKGFSATAVASRPAWTQMQQGAGGTL
jgi:hypothetical protein